MTAITFDEATLAKLKPLRGRVEVRDETGRIIGFYHPANPAAPTAPKSPYSEEELRRRQAEPGGATLSEVLKRLGQ